MPKPFPQLVGRSFGKWTVLSKVTGDKRQKHLCRCACGLEAVRSGYELVAGKTKGCKRCVPHRPRPDLRKSSGEAARNQVIAQYRMRAKKQGFEYALSLDEALALFSSNCGYCGAVPSNELERKGGHGPFVYNGIDRMDNRKGYVPGNVISCCWTCNRNKGDRSCEEFLDWVRRIMERDMARRGK